MQIASLAVTGQTRCSACARRSTRRAASSVTNRRGFLTRMCVISPLPLHSYTLLAEGSFQSYEPMA
jgi:hypothetical protein